MNQVSIKYVKSLFLLFKMTDNINIGVVGTGKLGTYHIQKLLKQNYVNFIGVFEL